MRPSKPVPSGNPRGANPSMRMQNSWECPSGTIVPGPRSANYQVPNRDYQTFLDGLPSYLVSAFRPLVHYALVQSRSDGASWSQSEGACALRDALQAFDRLLNPVDHIDILSAVGANSSYTPGQEQRPSAISSGTQELFRVGQRQDTGLPADSLLHPTMSTVAEAQMGDHRRDSTLLGLPQKRSATSPITFRIAEQGTSASPQVTESLAAPSPGRRSRNFKPLWCIEPTCDKTYQRPGMLARHLKEHHGHAEIVPQNVPEQGTMRVTIDQQSCLKILLARMQLDGLTKEQYEKEREAVTWQTRFNGTATHNDRTSTGQRWTGPGTQPELTHQGLVPINDQVLDEVPESWDTGFLSDWLPNSSSANVGHWDPAAYGE